MIKRRNNTDIVYLFFLSLMLIQDFIPIFGESFRILIIFFILIYSFKLWVINKRRINQKFYFCWAITIVVFFCFSSMWAIRPVLSYWLIVNAFFPILVVTFSMFLYATNREKVYNLLGIYYIAAILMLLYIICVLDFSAIEGNRVTRAINSDEETWNNNAIGLILATSIFCGYLLVKRLGGRIYKFCYILITVIMLYGILLTGSRKSLILLFVPIMCFSAFNIKRNFFLILISGYTIFLVGYNLVMNVPFFYEIIGERLEDLFNILSNKTDGTEDVSRMFLMKYGWEWFLEHPLVGVGVNNFRTLSNNTLLFAGRNFYAHNNYIEILVGCGLIGFIFYYSLHFYLLKQSLRLQSIASKWVISFLVITLFVDIGMVSYYDLITHYFLAICFIVIFQERYFRC